MEQRKSQPRQYHRRRKQQLALLLVLLCLLGSMDRRSCEACVLHTSGLAEALTVGFVINSTATNYGVFNGYQDLSWAGCINYYKSLQLWMVGIFLFILQIGKVAKTPTSAGLECRCVRFCPYVHVDGTMLGSVITQHKLIFLLLSEFSLQNRKVLTFVKHWFLFCFVF